MLGTKTISDLISSPSVFRSGRINIIEAPVSSGKTFFALTALPEWGGSPEKVLYLIDTTNGELHIQRNMITQAVDRNTYAFYDYNTKHIWGEQRSDNMMPVMTYSGFGSELRKAHSGFRLSDFEYIICDEMSNLVRYQDYDGNNANLIIAEQKLREIVSEGKVKIIALSATPQKIREHFPDLYYDVPFDKSDMRRLETFHDLPYSCDTKTILERIAKEPKPMTGILYTTQVREMKEYISYAQKLGIPANGFWSASVETQSKYPFSEEQKTLRETVLAEETIPEDIRLLVINASSETCIKIQGSKRKVDYIIVNNSDEEVVAQVRGRYHGDLDRFYYHDIAKANEATLNSFVMPERFLNVRLFKQERDELCAMLPLQQPNKPVGTYYSWPTVCKMLSEHGYEISPSKKDKNRNGQHYYVISRRPE